MWRDGDRYVKAYQVQTERFKSTNVEWISDGNQADNLVIPCE